MNPEKFWNSQSYAGETPVFICKDGAIRILQAKSDKVIIPKRVLKDDFSGEFEDRPVTFVRYAKGIYLESET